MNRFIEQCQADIEWRTFEIALLKKSTAMQSISKEIREVLLKYSIPALYAIWEGYVVTTFSQYVRIINEEKIPVRRIDTRIKAYHSFRELNLASPPSNAAKKESLVERMQLHFDGFVHLSANVTTNSNVDYDSLSSIMHRYGVTPVSEEKYKDRLSKFLNIRNKIAHGNNSVCVTGDHLTEFSSLINELMGDILDILSDHIENKKYMARNQ